MPVPKYILACIFSFLTISLFAQSTIAERLEEMIYNTQDFEESVKVYQSITPLDIEQMEDSVLFDYYYLGGYINRELKNHSKTIEYLSEARKLCETKLGTHTIQFV